MTKDYEVVLINVAQKINKVQFPMAFSVLVNALKRQSITATFVDLMLVPLEERDALLEKSILDKPAIYSFSIIAGNQHLDHNDRLARMIKERSPESIIVYGGPLPSAIPQMLLQRCACDYVVQGGGEVVFAQLINSLRAGEPKLDLPGIFFRDGDRIVGAKQKGLRQLDELAECDFEQFDTDYYVDYLRETNQAWEVMASRGCWADCSFCYKFMGNGISFKTADSILDEIEMVKERYNFDRFYFVDENFFQVKKYFLQFIKRKEERKVDFKFITQSRIDSIDDDVLSIGKEHGLLHMTTGVESATEQTLEKINKSLTLKQIEDGLASLRKYDIGIQVALIVGFAWDTVEDYESMLKFMVRNQLQKRAKVSYLTPLPATRLFDEAVSLGKITDQFEYIRNLGDLYWERMVNMTSLPDETVDHYYQAIAQLGQKDVVVPTAEKFLKQIRKIH